MAAAELPELIGYLTGTAASLMQMVAHADIIRLADWGFMRIDGMRTGQIRRFDAHVCLGALDAAKSITVALATRRPQPGFGGVPHLTMTRATALGPDIVNISIKWPLDRHEEARSISDHIARTCPIQSGFLHPYHDFRIQNEMSPMVLRWDGIAPRRIFWSDRFQADIVDLEMNPCHNHRWGALNFTSAWTLYLGPEYLRFVDPTRAFALCWDTAVVGEVLRLTLFEDPANSTDSSSVSILWAVREALAFESLAHQLAPLG